MIHLKISCKYLDSFLLNTIFFSRNKHILLHNCQTLYHKQTKKKSRNKVTLLCNCQTPYHK